MTVPVEHCPRCRLIVAIAVTPDGPVARCPNCGPRLWRATLTADDYRSPEAAWLLATRGKRGGRRA